MRAHLWSALLLGETTLLQVMMNAQIAEGRIRVIDISRARELLGIENKTCGSTGEIGKPSSRIENRFRGTFCQSEVFY